MKKKTALFLATLLIAAGAGLAGDNPVVGTWEVVSVSGTEADGTKFDVQIGKDGNRGRSMKIYTETHFAVVGHGADGTFGQASAGPYVLKGDTVTEKIENSSIPENVGKEWVHEFSISGDLWTSDVVNPVTGAKVKEVWKRVK